MVSIEPSVPPTGIAESGGDAIVLMVGDDLVVQTWMFTWWLDQPGDGLNVYHAPWDQLGPLMSELDEALPTQLVGEDLETALDRALHGALSDPVSERQLMTRLGEMLLPRTLIAQIAERRSRHVGVELRVTPPHRCVHVPWALLVVPGDGGDDRAPRLGELVTVVDDVPASFHVGRARIAADAGAAGAGLRIIDPVGERGRLFTRDQLNALAGADGFPPGGPVDALALSSRLHSDPPPRSLVFVGHVVGGVVGGGDTSLLLTPAPVGEGGVPPDAAEGRLSAADLVSGLTESGGMRGAELWPMPARVGIVACNSGSDLGRREPFGLVIACLNAGASWTIGTRWVLPADRAFRAARDLADDDPQPLAEVAGTVLATVDAVDPAEALGAELRERIRRWESMPSDAPPRWRQAASPLTWGALAIFRAQERVSVAPPGWDLNSAGPPQG